MLPSSVSMMLLLPLLPTKSVAALAMKMLGLFRSDRPDCNLFVDIKKRRCASAMHCFPYLCSLDAM